jgi:predicted short-subunit dehydrogenase-like oxidoreductase (DUF2520 family)
MQLPEISYHPNFVYYRKIFPVSQFKISFAGAGNVAGALCRELHKNGHYIVKIVSRNESSGRYLASSCQSNWSGDLVFSEESDIIIVAVPDHSLLEVLSEIKCSASAIVVHTAGSIGMDVFPSRLKNTGVFYPLQTFSPGRTPEISSVPFFIEGSDEITTGKLKSLAESISNSVYLTDTEHRRLLHLAAVFVSNFTNHMFTRGKDICADAGVPFDVLYPLMLETVGKAIEMGPVNSQTGPAVRYDLNTIEKHLDLLSYSPDMKNIYELITSSIIRYYKKK